MNNVVKFKKPFQFRIGTIIFGVLSLYLIILIFTFATHKKVSTYEVVVGDLSSYYSFHALAIRQEHVVKSPGDGYITYFTREDTKASAKSVVYALHNTGDFYQDLKTAVGKDAYSLSAAKKKEVLEMLDDYSYAYSDRNFYDVYSFHNSLNGKLLETMTETSAKASLLPGMSAYYAYQAGIVLYEEDGLENLSLSNFTSQQVDGTAYNRTSFANRQKVKAGESVYKLITDENWQLVVPLEDSLKKRLSEDGYIDVKFVSDGKQLTVPFQIVNREGREYLVMNFNSGLIRYAKSRYVDIDLVMNKTKGFKIPNSSITQLPFIAIPKEYIMESRNQKGVMKLQDASNEEEFVQTALFSSDDQYYYVRSSRLKVGDVIQIPESTSSYKISVTKKFPCIYCVNKGYAVVRIVNILEQNDDYSITEMGFPYSIRNYDHIVLDGSLMKEGEMIP